MAEVQDDKDQTTTEVEDDNFVWNTPVGQNEGGDEFKTITYHREDYINSLEFHFKDGWNNKEPENQFIKAIVVNWSIRRSETIGSKNDSNGKPYLLKLAPDENITLWAIRPAEWIFGMYYRSNRNPGGTNIGIIRGEVAYQKIGSGILAGFHGNASKGNIDQIGTVFHK